MPAGRATTPPRPFLAPPRPAQAAPLGSSAAAPASGFRPGVLSPPSADLFGIRSNLPPVASCPPLRRAAWGRVPPLIRLFLFRAGAGAYRRRRLAPNGRPSRGAHQRRGTAFAPRGYPVASTAALVAVVAGMTRTTTAAGRRAAAGRRTRSPGPAALGCRPGRPTAAPYRPSPGRRRPPRLHPGEPPSLCRLLAFDDADPRPDEDASDAGAVGQVVIEDPLGGWSSREYDG